MNRKPIALLAGVLAFFAGAYVMRHASDWLRREPAVSPDVVTKPWVQQALGESGVVITVPWQLQPKELTLPPEVAQLVTSATTLSHEADGLNVMAMHMQFVPGTPTSLEGAADGAINNLRTVPGTASVNGSKNEVTVIGQRAFEIQAVIKRERGVSLRMRGLVFGDGAALYQVLLVCREDQARGDAVWEKIRNGVRKGVRPALFTLSKRSRFSLL